jgi:hypothetical protein
VQLQQAEVALTQFRSELRTDLRQQVATGELGTETVAILTRGLDELRREVLRSLTV